MTHQARYRRQVMGFVAWILGCGLTPLAHAEVQGSVQIRAGWNLVAAPSHPEHRCAWTGLGLTLWATGRPSEGDPGAGGIERSEQISCKPESLDPTARASEPSDETRVVWVFARSDLELPIVASAAAAWVPAGWNMLAVPEETVYADPNILRISRWDAQAQRYKRIRLGDALEAGYGYLAFLEEAGAPFQDDCLGSKWSLETARALIETCPFSSPTPNGPAPRPLDPALPTHIVLEPTTEDSTARGARHDQGSIAPESSAHFTVTQTASGAWNIIENQPLGAQLPPLLRIHIDESPQGSDTSLSEANTDLPQKGAVLRVAELIAELSERFSPIEGVVWDERGSSAWMPLIDALQRRFFGPGVAARPPPDPGTFEAPAAVSPRGLFVALPKVALVAHDDRTWAHLVHVARPGRSQNFEVAYRRSKRAAQDQSFETTKTLAAPGDGWAITDLAIAARGDKVSVAWTQTQTGPKTQPKQSLIRVAESHNRGAHFLAPKTVRKNDAWKRGLSLGYDRFGHLHLVWGEAHKAYYLKDLTKEPENVFDVVVREKNDLVVSYALAHQNPLCHKPVAPCGCVEWSQEAYSYALETNPKTGEAFGPYRTRTEEAFVYNPSLTIDDDAVSIIAHQDRMWDNRTVPNPDWPFEKNVAPDEAGGICPKPGTRIAQAGFQEVWQRRAHDLEPQRHPEETPDNHPSGPQGRLVAVYSDGPSSNAHIPGQNPIHEGAGSDTPSSNAHIPGQNPIHEGAGSDTASNKARHQYLYDGTWHEEDQIRIAQRPLVEDAWSEPSTGARDVPVWPMREGLLEWKTADVPVEEGFKVGTFQNGVRQDWRHAVVAQLESPLHEGRHDAPKLAVKKQGHLVAVYSDGPSSNAHIPGQNPIFVTQSLDGGITWSRGIQVAHGYLPDAAATHDGEVGLLVYHLGAPGRATPPAPKIDMLRTRDLQVWERDTLNLYPPIPIHRTHHENGAHHPDLFDDPIGVPALSGHQALFVATWVRSEIDPQKGTRIVTTRAARAPETRRYEITHAGPLTVGQSTQFTITAVNAYDMRVHDDGKVHLGVASRGPGGISQRSPHAGTNQGSPHAGTNQGSPHEGTSPLRPGREAVDQAVPDLSPLGQVRPKGGPIDQALTHGETEDPAFRSENAANPTFRSENAANPTFRSENAANPTFGSENAQALALVEGRSPPATVQLQNGQATFVRLTTETDTTLLVQSEENPTGRASATTLLAYASGAAGNYQRAIEARDRMMRTVVDEATQQTWVFQVEYPPEASPQPGDETTGLASPLEEPGTASDAKYLASFERVWVYTQGIAVAQLSKQQDTVSQAAAQGMARYLCAHAEKGHHEGRTVILGWPFSWNTAGDNWKDRRLVTGANAWAIHGLGAFVVSKAFDSLSDKEQRAIRGCYEEAIRGLLVHRQRLAAPGTDQTVSLVTAGWTARGLTVAENPSALFREEEESVQWGYYSVLDAIGYEAFTEDRAPEVARFRHTPGAPRTKLAPRVLTEEDHQRLKTRVLASNVVTEHNLDVLSVLNHALKHQEKIGLQDFTELEVFRDELRDGIFVLLWDDQEYTQDLAYTLRQTGPDDPRRPALEEALETQDLGRIVTGGHFSGTGEDLHFSASNHVAIDNCSWLSLSVDHGLLPEQPEYIERLARCLRYTELQFVKPLPFAGRTYLGAHYFQNTFRDPYISPSALQESSYHLEATTGLILGLARFARAYPEHPDAGHFADQTRALWNGVQLFVKDHGFRYSSQRIQDLSTRLASSTAAIWFIDVYRELNQDWAGLRGIVGTGRVWDPERLAASSLAHKNVVSLGLYGGHEAFVGFQSQSGATWVDTKAPRSDDSVGPIYPEAQSTFGPGARATKPGTVLANVIKKGAASIDEFSPGTSFATSQLLAAGTALASIVALSTGQVETWTTLIHLNQAPNVHTEPWTFVGTVPEDEVTFLGLFFKDEALIRHTRIQQSHVQGGFATSTVEFEADAIYGLVKEVYGPSEGMLKDLYRLGLPTGEPISVYRLDTELSPEAIVDAVLDQQVPWLKPSADPAPNEPGFTADLFRELRALALTPDFHQIDLAELIHTLENQGAAPDSHDAQAIIPEPPLGTAWLDQVPEAFRASVYYWTVLLPQYVVPQSSGPLWDALQNDLSRLDENTCHTLGPAYVSRFPGAQVGWVPGSGNLPGRCVLTQAAATYAPGSPTQTELIQPPKALEKPPAGAPPEHYSAGRKRSETYYGIPFKAYHPAVRELEGTIHWVSNQPPTTMFTHGWDVPGQGGDFFDYLHGNGGQFITLSTDATFQNGKDRELTDALDPQTQSAWVYSLRAPEGSLLVKTVLTGLELEVPKTLKDKVVVPWSKLNTRHIHSAHQVNKHGRIIKGTEVKNPKYVQPTKIVGPDLVATSYLDKRSVSAAALRAQTKALNEILQPGDIVGPEKVTMVDVNRARTTMPNLVLWVNPTGPSDRKEATVVFEAGIKPGAHQQIVLAKLGLDDTDLSLQERQPHSEAATYLYVIENDGRGLNLEAIHRAHNPGDVLFPQGILSQQIAGALEYKKDPSTGKLVPGAFLVNPDFVPYGSKKPIKIKANTEQEEDIQQQGLTGLAAVRATYGFSANGIWVGNDPLGDTTLLKLRNEAFGGLNLALVFNPKHGYAAFPIKGAGGNHPGWRLVKTQWAGITTIVTLTGSKSQLGETTNVSWAFENTDQDYMRVINSENDKPLVRYYRRDLEHVTHDEPLSDTPLEALKTGSAQAEPKFEDQTPGLKVPLQDFFGYSSYYKNYVGSMMFSDAMLLKTSREIIRKGPVVQLLLAGNDENPEDRYAIFGVRDSDYWNSFDSPIYGLGTNRPVDHVVPLSMTGQRSPKTEKENVRHLFNQLRQMGVHPPYIRVVKEDHVLHYTNDLNATVGETKLSGSPRAAYIKHFAKFGDHSKPSLEKRTLHVAPKAMALMDHLESLSRIFKVPHAEKFLEQLLLASPPLTLDELKDQEILWSSGTNSTWIDDVVERLHAASLIEQATNGQESPSYRVDQEGWSLFIKAMREVGALYGGNAAPNAPSFDRRADEVFNFVASELDFIMDLKERRHMLSLLLSGYTVSRAEVLDYIASQEDEFDEKYMYWSASYQLVERDENWDYRLNWHHWEQLIQGLEELFLPSQKEP